jgi:uncharacterized protein (DUF2062 family)
MMSRWLAGRKRQIEGWLLQGISPRKLALTLALGFAVGCIPVVGVPTLLCAALAVALKLNLPAIQAANYLAMPLQVLLILPFMRLGGWMFASGHPQATAAETLLHGSPLKLIWASGSLAGEALGAWMVIAGPSVVLMTLALTLVLRRVPVLAAEPGE